MKKSLWTTLKETAVGIHADYHTGFQRLRDKYQNEETEEAPSRTALQSLAGADGGLYGFAKDYDSMAIRTKPRRETTENDAYLGSFVGSHGFTNATGILGQLEMMGWSNLVCLPSLHEGQQVQGNRYQNEYGTYQVITNSSGKILEVKTIEATTRFPEEVPDVSEAASDNPAEVAQRARHVL